MGDTCYNIKQNIEWSVDDRTNELIFDQRPEYSKIVSHRIAWRRAFKELKKNPASVETLRQAEAWGSSRNKQGHWLKHSEQKKDFQGDACPHRGS